MLFLTKRKLKRLMKKIELRKKYGTEDFFYELLYEIFFNFGMKKEQGFLIIPEKEK